VLVSNAPISRSLVGYSNYGSSDGMSALAVHGKCSAAEEAETAIVEVAWAAYGSLILWADLQRTKQYYNLPDHFVQGKLIVLHSLAFDVVRRLKDRWVPLKNRLKPHGRSLVYVG